MIPIRDLFPLILHQQVIEHAREYSPNGIGRYRPYKVEYDLDVIYAYGNTDDHSEHQERVYVE